VIAELAAAVRGRRVSAEELAREALARIEARDGDLNAVVALREEALEEARALDERVARGGDAGLLAGVPMLVKDIENITGMRTTYGSLVHAEDPPAERDDLVIARLRGAGAIAVGKSNTPEFAFEGFTDNRLFGATRNPWAPAFSPGGSSGGSGAAIAAGIVPIATATDGGGSIRIPASFCGLAGLKPTNGIVGRDPIPEWMDLSTCGPLAVSVADLELLLSVEKGPVAGDPTALPSWEPGRIELPDRLFAAPRFSPFGPLPEIAQRPFDEALRRLEALGFAIEPVEPGALFEGIGNPDEEWFEHAATEHAHFLGRELIEREAGKFTEYFAVATEHGLRTSIEVYLEMRRRRFDYCRRLDELLGPNGVIVTPTMPTEGWPPEGPAGAGGPANTPADAYNTQVQNLTGHPALSLPAGRMDNGVPFGLEFTGPRFRDDLLLALGRRWEEAHPWPLAADGFDPFSTA
jgi:Asp-tRNA(Asn)/Glu-tRNA(Gln) amidotransferase A subunit family amidase